MTRKGLVRKLDRIFSLYIRKRDGRSVLSGNTQVLQCGHLFTRAAYSTRWDEQNAFAITHAENLRHEYDPAPLTIYFLNKFGNGEYAKLHRKHKSLRKFANSELEIMIEYFETKSREL